MVFYTLYDDPSIPLCIYKCCLFNFYYNVASFVFYQKKECKSIYYHFRRDHESSSFRKLAKNRWICRETCDFFAAYGSKNVAYTVTYHTHFWSIQSLSALKKQYLWYLKLKLLELFWFKNCPPGPPMTTPLYITK